MGTSMNDSSKVQEGRKDDVGKPRFDLLPPEVLEQITAILTGGAEKYGARNWEQGMSWGRLFAAAQRHQWRFWSGAEMDEESGLPHLAHAIVSLMFLLEFANRDMRSFDDRQHSTSEQRGQSEEQQAVRWLKQGRW